MYCTYKIYEEIKRYMRFESVSQTLSILNAVDFTIVTVARLEDPTDENCLINLGNAGVRYSFQSFQTAPFTQLEKCEGWISRILPQITFIMAKGRDHAHVRHISP